jgi:hypothetical protein
MAAPAAAAAAPPPSAAPPLPAAAPAAEPAPPAPAPADALSLPVSPPAPAPLLPGAAAAPPAGGAPPAAAPPAKSGGGAPPRPSRLRSLLLSTNAQAALLFLAYTALYVYIDLAEWPAARAALRAASASAAGGDDYAAPLPDSAYQVALRRVHLFYVAAALIHVANAVQYLSVWPAFRNPASGAFWRLWDWVQAPEWLNFCGAALSLAAAAQLDAQRVVGPERFSDGTAANVAQLELAAAVLQAAAVVGWAAVWYATHARGAGRGTTPADPECLAVLALAPAAGIAVAFRAAALQSPVLSGNPAVAPFV